MEINPFAILADSQHFQKTLIITLGFFNSDTLTFNILSFLENFGIGKKLWTYSNFNQREVI